MTPTGPAFWERTYIEVTSQSFSFFLKHLLICVYVFVHTHGLRYMLNPEVDSKSLPKSRATLFFDVVPLTEPADSSEPQSATCGLRTCAWL